MSVTSLSHGSAGLTSGASASYLPAWQTTLSLRPKSAARMVRYSPSGHCRGDVVPSQIVAVEKGVAGRRILVFPVYLISQNVSLSKRIALDAFGVDWQDRNAKHRNYWGIEFSLSLVRKVKRERELNAPVVPKTPAQNRDTFASLLFKQRLLDSERS